MCCKPCRRVSLWGHGCLCWADIIKLRHTRLSYKVHMHIQYIYETKKKLLHLCVPVCLPSGIPIHDDVIKWKHFPRHWPFVGGIHRSPVNSPHKGQWLGALMFSLIYAWINGWVNNSEAGDTRRHRTHYDVIVMFTLGCTNKYMCWTAWTKWWTFYWRHLVHFLERKYLYFYSSFTEICLYVTHP